MAVFWATAYERQQVGSVEGVAPLLEVSAHSSSAELHDPMLTRPAVAAIR